jgi:adenylosuccinate lyase
MLVGKRNCSGTFETSSNLGFHSVKGTTGMQVSFLMLFDGDHDKVCHPSCFIKSFFLMNRCRKVKELDRLVTEMSGFLYVYPVTSQTYSHKIDINMLAPLTSFSATAYKIAFSLISRYGHLRAEGAD